jgi:hypothetical protein
LVLFGTATDSAFVLEFPHSLRIAHGTQARSSGSWKERSAAFFNHIQFWTQWFCALLGECFDVHRNGVPCCGDLLGCGRILLGGAYADLTMANEKLTPGAKKGKMRGFDTVREAQTAKKSEISVKPESYQVFWM